MNRKKNQRELCLCAPFVLPDNPKFGDVALDCRGLLQKIRTFGGARWVDLFSKPDSQNLEPDEEILKQLQIPRSMPARAKKQTRRAVKLQRGVWVLGRDAVRFGDDDAARELVSVATAAVEVLTVAKAQNPKLFHPILRNSHLWPVMAGMGRDGFASIQCEVRGLGEAFLEREGFKSAALERWSEVPARKWAYGIKTILEWNRILAFAICKHWNVWPQLKKHLLRQKGIAHVYSPPWFLKCGLLPEFSRSTVPQWMALGKEMVKEQMPDFDQREEWRNWDRRAATRTKPGNSPRSKKRSDIFDSIQSAMETITKEGGLPK